MGASVGVSVAAGAASVDVVGKLVVVLVDRGVVLVALVAVLVAGAGVLVALVALSVA